MRLSIETVDKIAGKLGMTGEEMLGMCPLELDRVIERKIGKKLKFHGERKRKGLPVLSRSWWRVKTHIARWSSW